MLLITNLKRPLLSMLLSNFSRNENYILPASPFQVDLKTLGNWEDCTVRIMVISDPDGVQRGDLLFSFMVNSLS